MIDTKDITLANVIEAVEQRDKAIADMKEKLDMACKGLDLSLKVLMAEYVADHGCCKSNFRIAFQEIGESLEKIKGFKQ